MANEPLEKMSDNPGASNSANRMDSQNINRHGVEVKRMAPLESSALNVPGQGDVSRAAGDVREGSARAYAEAMDAMTGDVNTENVAASGK